MKFALPMLMLLTSTAFAGGYDEYQYPFFFGRQPGARSEAMGRSYLLLADSPFASFYNPAGTIFTNGANVGYTRSSPFYVLQEAFLEYSGASYKAADWIAVNLRYDHFTYGNEILRRDESNEILAQWTPFVRNVALNCSVEKDGYSVGLNLNYYHDKYSSAEGSTCYPIDIGLAKAFHLKGESRSQHTVAVGTSIKNILGARIELNDMHNSEASLPVLFRVGGSYMLHLNRQENMYDLYFLSASVQCDYQDLFNSRHLSGFFLGSDITLFEILSLRIGYYTYSLDNTNSPNTKANLEDFTYGFGITLPLDNLSNREIPLTLSIDYVNLEQPSHVTSYPYPSGYVDWNDFSTITLQLKWHTK